MGQQSATEAREGEEEFHLALTEERFEDLTRALSPDQGPNADEDERGAYCVITRSTGSKRATYLIHEVVVPADGAVEFTSEGLQFDPDYKHKATERAADVDGGGLLIAHTHPGGKAAPSTGDDRADATDLYTAGQRLDAGAPLASAVYSEAGSWYVRSCDMDIARLPSQHGKEDFGPHTATWTPATAIRVVGTEFNKIETTEPASGPKGATGQIDETLVDSSRRLWEMEGHEKLAGLRIGVIGCGGGGSILSELLPRLGVGEVVFVDYDHLEPSNANRALGASKTDIRERRLKVRVAARVAERSAVAEDFKARPVVGSVVESKRPEYDPLPHLLDCDIIFTAADLHWARKVVDDIAHTHLIPVIDGGTALETDDDGQLTGDAQSNITLSGPGHPCLECASMWKPHEAGKNKEGHRGDVYVDGARAPSVISMNTLVESLTTQRLQAFVLGVAPDATKGALRYLPATAETRWREVQLEGRLVGCRDSCDRPALEAAGDAANENLDRYRDPFLSDHLDDGLEASGVVEPAPYDAGPASEGDAESPTKSLTDRLRNFLDKLL